jgi:N-acetylneuraminate synthase
MMNEIGKMNSFKIANREVGEDFPPLIIAEIGINHEGSLDVAIELVDSAINSGAEVIKHQTHIVEDEMSEEAKNIFPVHASESIYEIIKRCALDEADEYKLMRYVQQRGSIFISTPFSRAAAIRLAKFDIPAFKIGSGECNNYHLVKFIASFKRPIILSTGMNSVETIRPAVEILRSAGVPFALLHCTNIYPTPPELVRLGAIQILKQEFPDAVIGLSDHTTTNFTCLGAVALGASILEKHYTDSMSRPGPDISSSMNPESLKSLIMGSEIIYRSRGNFKGPVEQESNTMAFAFASVVAIKNIYPGEELNESNIWLKRPGGGDFGVSDYENLFGKVAAKPILKDYQISKFHIC